MPMDLTATPGGRTHPAQEVVGVVSRTTTTGVGPEEAVGSPSSEFALISD